MALKGMLIDYENCTGCHSCEMACSQEYGHDPKAAGIVVNQVGPLKLGGKRWEIDYVPVPTQKCVLCAGRMAKGKRPTCAMHCQSRVITVGEVGELAAQMTSPKQVLYAVRG